jgi:1,4-dihydroxy-2-naphthoate octaprenyltransferase
MPVYLFALAISPNLNETRLHWSFLIVHLLLYPASNGFNSYFDKDEKSIGGLKNPPPVKKGLYYSSLLLDVIAITLGFMLNSTFAIMLFIYGMVSKAYSHPMIRLKKYPIAGWLVAGLFQGCFTFLMCYAGINNFSPESFWNASVMVPAIVTTIMLWANYPMTQVYQHEEDRKHGDTTISMRLGIENTFYFAGLLFALSAICFVIYFTTFHTTGYAVAFLIALAPVTIYFLIWLAAVKKDASNANYSKAMGLNFISALCLNGFFTYFFLDSSQVLQAIRGGY